VPSVRPGPVEASPCLARAPIRPKVVVDRAVDQFVVTGGSAEM